MPLLPSTTRQTPRLMSMSIRMQQMLPFTIPLPRQKLPQIPNRDPLHRQHAVLQTVEILPMNRRDELAGHEAEEDARGEVVFAEAVPELVVLGEGLGEGEGDGLWSLC